jgi:hypothetical protein
LPAGLPAAAFNRTCTVAHVGGVVPPASLEANT